MRKLNSPTKMPTEEHTIKSINILYWKRLGEVRTAPFILQRINMDMNM